MTNSSSVRNAKPFAPQRTSEVGNPLTPGILTDPTRRNVSMANAFRVKPVFGKVA